MNRTWAVLWAGLCWFATSPAVSVPGPPVLWGAAPGLYPRQRAATGASLADDVRELRREGARSLWLDVRWTQSNLWSSDLAPTLDTPSDARIARWVAEARRQGLHVALSPGITLHNAQKHHWRGVLSPAQPERWWRAYTQMILHYADLAQAHGVAVFSLGAELGSLTSAEHAGRWRDLARRVRRRFRGQLTYVANHDALAAAPFAVVDLLGVSAYFPLAARADAQSAELDAAWRDIVERLGVLSSRHGRPVLLAEVGYPSMDGGSVRPWDYTRGAPLDVGEQAASYRALFRALCGARHVQGVFFWQWWGAGGRFDRGYTPRGKPAQHWMRKVFARRGSCATGD